MGVPVTVTTKKLLRRTRGLRLSWCAIPSSGLQRQAVRVVFLSARRVQGARPRASYPSRHTRIKRDTSSPGVACMAL